jgi:hypothetical protein
LRKHDKLRFLWEMIASAETPHAEAADFAIFSA